MPHFSHKSLPFLGLGRAQRVQAQFGFTQQELADLLGVSRSALTMSCGRGQRALPPAAGQRLNLLADALPVEAPPAAGAAAPALDQATAHTLRQRRQRLTLDRFPLAQQLERSQTRLAQLRRREQVLPAVRAALPPEEARLGGLLALWAEYTPDWLRAEEATQAQLALRLRVLDFELAELEQLLAAGAPPA